MTKKNLSRIENQYCSCQREEHGDDAGFLAEPLQRVRSRDHYERKHEAQKEPGEMPSMFDGGPNVPTTEDGTEITFENFPDCNFVCPVCEQEWLAVVDIYPVEERGKHFSLEWADVTQEEYVEWAVGNRNP